MWTGSAAKSFSQRHTAGFTLLEVLVALAIVATALVAFMRVHLLSLDATVRAQDLTTAVLLAQTRMAALGMSPNVGEEQGKYEDPELTRFRWVTVVTEEPLGLELGGSASTVAPAISLLHMSVTVAWADGSQERYYTLENYGIKKDGRR